MRRNFLVAILCKEKAHKPDGTNLLHHMSEHIRKHVQGWCFGAGSYIYNWLSRRYVKRFLASFLKHVNHSLFFIVNEYMQAYCHFDVKMVMCELLLFSSWRNKKDLRFVKWICFLCELWTRNQNASRIYRRLWTDNESGWYVLSLACFFFIKTDITECAYLSYLSNTCYLAVMQSTI